MVIFNGVGKAYLNGKWEVGNVYSFQKTLPEILEVRYLLCLPQMIK